jgi:hypothetical protein
MLRETLILSSMYQIPHFHYDPRRSLTRREWQRRTGRLLNSELPLGVPPLYRSLEKLNEPQRPI